jgi:hypothetical protein
MSAISSITSAYLVSAVEGAPPPAPKPAHHKDPPPQDTVNLSDAARAAAAGDADHDGDSH